ncbi:flagellin [Polynucleobacter corsicus]|uniref:flagellin N-terminal helical domain-containing protein n=1 Tax=Polynucleobacter corsicus TaxID=2081042 RepID=UPI001BFE3D96|nr:flagellin [Polynucleobacter corsicus]QWE19304.1 flagellin FliC [Polynucleobacter corsicus]QWE19305.1 flagellin FliC [Polynucleobacter corsicus]
MPAVLNTNMASLYAQKNLATAQADLAGSVQKLSSGKRINSAKDDAAGYAVAEAVKATKNITDQSIRNTQDAISLVQTAEGALDVVSKMLQRVLTLTTQKENGTLTTTQTTSINNEITSMLSEVGQINSRTRFQGGSASLFGTTSTFTTGSGTAAPTQTTVTIASLSLSALDRLSSGVATAASTGTAITIGGGMSGAAAVGDKIFKNGVDTGLTAAAAITTTGATNLAITTSAALTVAIGDVISVGSAAGISSSSNSASIMNAVQVNIENRAKLGASQQQLNYIVDNMQTLSNNLADAQSRIIDTDYASETANLTRGQILQQAATSMLAQANQMPNVILTLLK